MEKVSAEHVDHLMVKAASALRSLQAENVALRQRVDTFERERHAEKIASVAVANGALSEDESEDYISNLVTSNDDLTQVERYVGMARGGLSLGRPLEKTASDSSGSSADQNFFAALNSGDM